jgi:hypothetical protein
MTLLIACILGAPVSASGAQSRGQKYDIVEAVLRRYMKHYPPAKGYKLYYIGVELDGNDVTKELLKRFAESGPPVKEFEPSKHDPGQVRREGGIVLGIRGVERINKSKVKVYGLTFVSGFGEGLNWIHELRRRGRDWIVTDEASLNLS